MKHYLLFLLFAALNCVLSLEARAIAVDSFPSSRCLRYACDTTSPVADAILIVSGYCNQAPCAHTMLTGADGCADVTAQPQIPTPLVQFASPGSTLQGVNMYDVYRMRQNILGIAPLEHPWQFIAGDVNLTGSITTFDMLVLQRAILGLEGLNENNNWRFIDSDLMAEFENWWGNPFETPIDGIYADMDRIDVIKIGDLDCSYLANQTLTGDTIFITVDEHAMIAGQPFNAVFRLQDPAVWTAMQFQVELISDVNITGFTASNVPGMNENAFALFNNELNVAWVDPVLSGHNFTAGEALFTLELTPVNDGDFSNVAFIDRLNAITLARAYETNGIEHPIGLRFTTSSATQEPTGQAYTVRDIWPNPTAGSAGLLLTNNESKEMRLTVADAAGRVVWSEQKMQPAGQIQWEIPEDALQPQGVYFWQLNDGKHFEQGKILTVTR